jgi:hypothetical protein
MPAPSLSFRRPAFFGVAGPLAAVIVALASDASAQPAPASPPRPSASPSSTGLVPPPPPGAIEAAPVPPVELAPQPGAGAPAAPGYGPVAPTWQPPAQAYWPPYAPQYPPSPSFYRSPEPFSLPPPAPKEAANRTLMITGIVAAVGGVATLVTGSILMSIAKERIDVYRDGPAYCCSIDDAPLRNAGITLLVAGGITAAIGIPLWMIGGRRVPVRKSTTEKPGDAPTAPKTPALRMPLLRVGATRASLSWQF